jgi:RNA polymerase sigma factor (sigma-70 family)
MNTTHSSERRIGLDAVIRTAQLQHRTSRRPDYDAENRALVALAQVLTNPPRDILQRLVDVALELCQSGSAGISIIEDNLGEKVFRWHALAGALASHRWGTTPRDFSPCGIVIDRNAVQLMHLPERYFLYLTNVKPQVVEVLLVPFSVRGQPVGTIWVVAHDDHRKFDAEDERLIKELGHFATEAYQLASSVTESKISDRRKDEFLAALGQELRCPLFALSSEMQNRRDSTVNRASPSLQGMSDASERQLKSMKRVIIDLLDRSRVSFEKLAATSALSKEDPDAHDGQGLPAAFPEPSIGGGFRTTVSRLGSVPLPRGRARGGRDNVANGSSEGTAAATDAVSLLRRMRRGDQHALGELYDCTVGSVYALARAILRNAEDAEEVVCDTYAQAWRQSERFDAERASPIGWLMMMCRTRAIDRLRHNRSHGSARTVVVESVCEFANDAQTPEELLSLFHNGSRVQDALATLSPQRLELVGLAFFEGLSFPEIAERTSMPLGTVKSHIRRALVELGRKLQSSELPALGRRRRRLALARPE